MIEKLWDFMMKDILLSCCQIACFYVFTVYYVL